MDPYKYNRTHCKYLRIDDIINCYELDKKKVIPRYCNKEEIKDCVYCSLIKNNNNVKRIEKLPSYETKTRLTFLFEKFKFQFINITKIRKLYGKCKSIKFRDVCGMQYLIESQILNNDHFILFQNGYLKNIPFTLSNFLKSPENKLSIILKSRAFYNITDQLVEKEKKKKIENVTKNK